MRPQGTGGPPKRLRPTAPSRRRTRASRRTTTRSFARRSPSRRSPRRRAKKHERGELGRAPLSRLRPRRTFTRTPPATSSAGATGATRSAAGRDLRASRHGLSARDRPLDPPRRRAARRPGHQRQRPRPRGHARARRRDRRRARRARSTRSSSSRRPARKASAICAAPSTTSPTRGRDAHAMVALDGAGDERIIHRALGSRRFRVSYSRTRRPFVGGVRRAERRSRRGQRRGASRGAAACRRRRARRCRSDASAAGFR